MTAFLNKMDWMIIFIVLVLLFLLWIRGRNGQMKKMPSSISMPGYRLVYADQKQGKKGEEDFGKLLYSAEYALQGKPDYVFQKRFGKGLVPIEVKSGAIGDEPLPHRGDLLQLGAYFLILEDVYKIRPKEGKLVYRDHMFLVRNTKGFRQEIQRTMKEMREMLQTGVGKANPSFATCRFCVCNGTVCPHSETEIIGGKTDESSCGEEQNL